MKIRSAMTSESNITEKILELVDRKLWHVENHPLQTLALRYGSIILRLYKAIG